MKKTHDGKKLIFVAYITVNGRRLYARQYGRKAWDLGKRLR